MYNIKKNSLVSNQGKKVILQEVINQKNNDLSKISEQNKELLIQKLENTILKETNEKIFEESLTNLIRIFESEYTPLIKKSIEEKLIKELTPKVEKSLEEKLTPKVENSNNVYKNKSNSNTSNTNPLNNPMMSNAVIMKSLSMKNKNKNKDKNENENKSIFSVI